MQQWYERNESYKKRLLREINFIKQYKRKYPKSNITYEFYGSLKIFSVWYVYEYDEKIYGIFCTYPLLYPKTRIEVRVSKYDSEKRKVLPFEKGYHNSDGILCLYLHYPNEWKEDYGIEDIIKRVGEWFKYGQYDKKNNVPINYNIFNDLFIFPEPLTEGINQDYGTFEYSNIRDKICVAKSITAGNQNMIVKELPKSLISENEDKKKGIIVCTSKPINSKEPTDFSEIKSYLNCFNKGVKGFINFAERNNINFPIPLVIIYKNQNYEGQAFFINKSEKGFEIITNRFTYFRVYEDIFSRVKSRNDLDYIKRKKVAVIGLGAIGSVVATELARSGVGNFILIDKDKLEIQNIGRHDLTLCDIDKYKADAMIEKILDINPVAKCESYPVNVLDDYSISLLNLLSCDLVISTIDDQEAKYAIDSTLIPYVKKVLYSGAFYNSVAGFVMVSDKRMGCFKCISQILDYMADNEEIPDFSEMVPKDIEYNCGLPTFPGGSVNTHTISLLTTKIATDLLLGRRETDSNNQPYNLYLIGNEEMSLGDKQFFKGYMDIKKYILPGVEGCEICDQEIILSEAESKQYYSIMEKLKK